MRTLTVLFDKSNTPPQAAENNTLSDSGNPHPKAYVEKCVKKFGRSYSLTVQEIIMETEDRIDEGIFLEQCRKADVQFQNDTQRAFQRGRLFQRKRS